MLQAVIAFDPLGQWLLERAREILPQWFPNGRWIGREFCVGNLQGEPGQSLKINGDTGLWQDFANGTKGRDLIALWARMHGINMLEAATELAHKYGYGPITAENVTVLRPATSEVREPKNFEWPPADAPRSGPAFKHPKHGQPTQVFPYLSLDRRLIYLVARYELPDGKQFAPYTWHEGKWRAKGHPAPRPLYGLNRLEEYSGPTIIVEGEKKADALQAATTKSSVLSWAGGANNWSHHDWSPLQGRQCILWPDADPAGFNAMQGIAGLLLFRECGLRIIDTEGLPEHWDAYDVCQQHKGRALAEWIKVRLRPLTQAKKGPEPVQAPKSIPPAVTVDAAAVPPAYALAQRYGLSFGKGGVYCNAFNARRIIAGLIADNQLGALTYDIFLQRVLVGADEWTEVDTLRLTDHLQQAFQMHTLRKNFVQDAVTLYAYDHRVNCAQDWLHGLVWDEKPRIDRFFTRGMGADDNELNRAIGKAFLIGIAARIQQPGCQLDTLPVIEGEQGGGKSSAMRALGGVYHTECHESVMGKDFYLVLHGKVLVEIAELDSFRRADAERIKGIITNRSDRYRAPYERAASDHPRVCAFVATTNRDDWNHDETGARRFWPIRSGKIDVDWIERNREALFAEAYHRLRTGESWWSVPKEAIRVEQQIRREEDMLEQSVLNYVGDKPSVRMSDVVNFALSLEGTHKYDRQYEKRIAAVLREAGFRKHAQHESGKLIRVWRKAYVQERLNLMEEEEGKSI